MENKNDLSLNQFININNLTYLGEGGTSKIYINDENIVWKIFDKNYSLHEIVSEFHKHEIIRKICTNTPNIYQLWLLGHNGIIKMEYIRGNSILSIMKRIGGQLGNMLNNLELSIKKLLYK
ncbi:hypothetical protein [Breznakia pachnodae]|uniref:Serine/threonine protein kinase n=1 Tax=Breznakia pachnodae TaxID=265178 RepID=A0ABU0E8S6_9FIRM|nr:hypothetical protein [Breznakia pachnodae]MDQ0363301.1 hypothetical protein [Breznakia pachnodae]